MYQVTIDDSQVMDFVRQSPVRAKWANSEALKMSGGHVRKEIRAFIESGGRGWRKLHPATALGKGIRSPLHWLGKLVRFKYGMYRGAQRVQIGFFGTRTLSQRQRKAAKKKTGYAQRYSVRGAQKETGRMQRGFSMTDEALARVHEYGKRFRVTPRMRRRLAATPGLTLKKTTRVLEIPARPMIGPVFAKMRNEIPLYHEQRFFQKFFSGEKPHLKI